MMQPCPKKPYISNCKNTGTENMDFSRLIQNTMFEIDATFYQITFYWKREGTTDISLNSIYFSCRARCCMR